MELTHENKATVDRKAAIEALSAYEVIAHEFLEQTDDVLLRSIVVQVAVIAAALVAMFSIYGFIQKRERQAEVEKALAELEFSHKRISGQVKKVLGVEIPNVVIPVSEGRDLVNLVETAALQEKLLLSGCDPVGELSERLRRRATEHSKRKGVNKGDVPCQIK